MDRPGAGPEAESPNSTSDDEPSGDAEPSQHRHRDDISFVPYYPMRSVRSGLKRDDRGGCGDRLMRNRGWDGGAVLVLDHAIHPLVAFSVGLPCGIQLSSLPGPRNVREVMGAHDADGRMEAMVKEMATLKYYDVYETVPRIKVVRNLKLGRKIKSCVFDKNKARMVTHGNYQRHGMDYGDLISSAMRLESLHTLLAIVAPRDLDVTQSNIISAYLLARSRRRFIWSSQMIIPYPGRRPGSGGSRGESPGPV